ncbi:MULTISPECIES: class I SAM-dependent methyltransferase [Flavobacterium]|uniref:class I SAM-dependent methyltransferase n=1 Tax=Flavobacterium TaxID=237 RepID=UPI00211391B8|nr:MULTISPECIES: methyltransferase domain-containing protein [Flavobacterium]UUF14650.1 methyltransferase domain-containing protein [Flavobacterium panici]
MEKHLQEIREQQKISWNKFSPGWKKWDKEMMDFLKPMGEKMIDLLDLKATDHVLDIASGTGEPALSIANYAKKVTITDLSNDMLIIANENAENRGIKNVDFVNCDVCELPFSDESFDAVSCRLGFMFFPDMDLAAKEIFRVLKPGGRVVTSVWDIPEKNFWLTAIGGSINRNMELPPPNPGAPGVFRCAKSGLIEDLFHNAGFKNVKGYEVKGKLNYETPERYWSMMTEIAAPVVAALSNADDQMRQKIKTEVLEIVQKAYPDKVIIEGNSFVIVGVK